MLRRSPFVSAKRGYLYYFKHKELRPAEAGQLGRVLCDSGGTKMEKKRQELSAGPSRPSWKMTRAGHIVPGELYVTRAGHQVPGILSRLVNFKRPYLLRYSSEFNI